MGMMKQMWADNFKKNTQVTSQLMQKLPDGTWVPYPYVPEDQERPLPLVSQFPYPLPVGTGCRHEWKSVPGIYKVYVNCKHCGIGKETLQNATNS
jgi:hypothetical protein